MACLKPDFSTRPRARSLTTGSRATWRARLDEHLGNYVVEGLDLASARFLDAAHALYGLMHIAALCRLLPERDPHPQIHATLDHVLGALVDAPAQKPGNVVDEEADAFSGGELVVHGERYNEDAYYIQACQIVAAPF